MVSDYKRFAHAESGLPEYDKPCPPALPADIQARFVTESGLILCGMDEAGRGPLAGPVTAGAVILPAGFPLEKLNDSKKLSAKRRDEAESLIKQYACWGIGIVDHTQIDKMNILQASLYAMQLAFNMLVLRLPAYCRSHQLMHDGAPFELTAAMLAGITDGTFCAPVSAPCRCEPKADGTYAPVMAASIIAKTERDRIMTDYDKRYPEYGYAKHKGYPTAAHVAVCRRIGPSPIQRLSFKY